MKPDVPDVLEALMAVLCRRRDVRHDGGTVGTTGHSVEVGDTTVSHESGAVDARVPGRGAVLGRYVVVAIAGEGGMGRVLRAYDSKLRREVALKMLRLEGDASAREQIISEARSMARLSHPNALPVYDIDFHQGRPFIAMEYVEGMTLRDWLAEQQRPLREIIDAFAAAGAGLAAAHAVGLVHRDFKPTNVLRGMDGRIRVMDFGIASAATEGGVSTDSASWPDAAEHPTVSFVVGTPGYMAPEQHRGGPVDARCDQYAFAASLWEALCGARPFSGETPDELVRAKATMELTPSEPRTTIPSHLRRALLRGLAPDPDDRFDSMEAMLTGLRRDPGRRRRWAALSGLCLVGVTGTLAFESFREEARQAQCRALGDSIDEVWGPENASAIQVAFGQAPPPYAADTFVRLQPWLDRYAEQWATLRAETCLHPSPDSHRNAAAIACLEERRADLEAFVDLLRQADAEVVTMAVPNAARLPANAPCGDASFLATMPAPPEDRAARESLADLRRSLAQIVAFGHAGRFDAAHERIGATLEQAETLGYAPLVAKAWLTAGRVARWRGKFSEARNYTERAFELAAQSGFDDIALEAAVDLTTLVGVKLAEHDVGLTWGRFAETLIKRQAWQGRPIHGRLLAGRGRIFTDRAQFEAAIETLGQALRIQEDHLGAEHPGVADVLSDLGNAFERKKDYDASIEHHRRSLQVRRAALGEAHPSVAASLNNLGNAHWGRGDIEVAADYLEQAAEIKAAAYGDDHLTVGSTLQNLGNVMYSEGRYEEAIAYWTRTLEIRDRALPEAHPDRATVLSNLAAGYLVTQQLDDAFDYARRALEVTQRVHGPQHVEVAQRWRTLGAVHQGRGDDEQALQCFREEVAIVRKAHGDGHEAVAEARRELGKMLALAGNRVDAIAEFERALEILERIEARPRSLALVQMHLATNLAAEDRSDTARVRELAEQAHAVLCEEGSGSEDCMALARMTGRP